MNKPGRSEIRAFGGGLMTLSVVLWVTYATALSNNGQKHYLPHWTLLLAIGGLVAGVAVVAATIFWPTKKPGP